MDAYLVQKWNQEFYIELDSVKRCMIPSSFFSCLALEHVHIFRGTIHVPRSLLGFKFLRTLRLFLCKLTGNVSRLISSCPLLEILELSRLIEYGRLVIRAPNLRWLSIGGEFGDLCLETPKLSYANISLLIYIGCFMNFSLPSEDCKSNILRVLGSLSVIEELELHVAFVTYLAMGPIPEALPVPFYRLTKLHIDLCSAYKEEVAAAFCLLKSAPNLKMLCLLLDKEVRDYPSSLAQSFWEVEGIEPDLFNCLEIVKILNFDYLESTLNVAKFFLSTAPVLEKLHIMECNVVDSNDVRSFMKKLASFSKLSKMVKVDFVY